MISDSENKKLMFIGIGGMGMGPLAIYTKQIGFEIFGYDDNEINLQMQLQFQQQEIVILPKNIQQFKFSTTFFNTFSAVVISSAIQQNHFLLQYFRQYNIPIIKRGNFLAELIKHKKLIAITGSHGKTSTTAMLINKYPEFDYILGGIFTDANILPANYNKNSKYVICEIDESDHTIENFYPDITITLNLDDDHISNYQDSTTLTKAFSMLFSKTKSAIIIPNTHPELNNIATNNASEKTKIFKFKNDHKFNISNTNAVNCVCSYLLNNTNFNETQAITNMTTHQVFRRDEHLGYIKNLKFFADYAHNPTEIQSWLLHFKNIHNRFPDVIFFQPHRYTRTQQYCNEFAKVLSHSSQEIYLLPIYCASENSIPGITSRLIFDKIKCKNKHLLSSNQQVMSILQNLATKTNPLTVAFIGAGNIYTTAKNALISLKIRSLQEILTQQNIEFKSECDLKPFNSWKLDLTCKLLILPKNTSELKIVTTNLNWPFLIIGFGTNLLLDCDDIVYISLKNFPKTLSLEHDEVTASANISLIQFCNFLAEHDLEGCENLSCIPGTIGGAIYMNAGAHDQCIADCLQSVTIFNAKTSKVETISSENIKLSYRHGLQYGVILSATFKFTKHCNTDKLTTKIKENITWRRVHQPSEPNAGSVFKNPIISENHFKILQHQYSTLHFKKVYINENCQKIQLFAGELIELSGLKGYDYNGVQISAKHANFIVNTSKTTTANTLKNLIQYIQSVVFDKFKIFLHCEISFASNVKIAKIDSQNGDLAKSTQ